MKTLLCYFNVDGFAIQLKNHVYDALSELDIELQECHISQLLKHSREFQPTMTILFHPNHELLDYLPVLKELSGHKLLWSMEDPYESDITFAALPYVYYIFTSDENTAEALKAEATSNEIYYVPHACNPNVHKPIDVSWEYKSDVLFVGNAYDSRIKWLQDHAEEFKNKLFTLVGVGYRGLDGYQNQRVIHGHISEGEMVKYINGAKLVLNLHRLNSDLDMKNDRGIPTLSLNNRYYEVSACGKPQLVVGRGEKFTTSVDDDTAPYYQKEHSYKARLLKYYLPLLKK